MEHEPTDQEPKADEAVYWWVLSVSIGLAIGAGIGALVGSIAAGVAVGVGVGVAVGLVLARRASTTPTATNQSVAPLPSPRIATSPTTTVPA
jgi:hypothetical protein